MLQIKNWIVFILVLILMVDVVYARGYKIKKKVGSYEAEIKIDKNPPVIGDNHIEIEIKDSAGNHITDARVLINYYMPPMPRMAPMNYRIDAKLKGESYRAKMVLIMSGPWAIVTEITHQGKRHTVKLSIDVS